MTIPRCIEIDGKPYVWSELIRLRRAQLAAVTKAEQVALFELREDRRPEAARTAQGRYLEPSLFDALT